MTTIRKNILFVVPYNPLLGSRGAQGPKNVSQPLIGLVSRVHDVVLIVVVDDATLTEAALRAAFPALHGAHICRPVTGWARRWWRLRYLLQGLPLSLADGSAPGLPVLLERYAATCDLVHFEYFTLAPHIAPTQRRRPVALHCHDAYSLYQQRCLAHSDGLWAKLAPGLRQRMFQKLERQMIARSAAAMTVSPVDQQYLLASGLSNVHYLPPAFQHVDVAVRAGRHAEPVELLCVVPATYQEFQLVTLRAFFREVLPGLALRYRGQLSVTLFGKTASRLKVELPAPVPVTAVDFAEDYFTFLGSRNWLYLYPQRAGAGLHTKVRDAMAAELPVIGYAEILNAFDGKSWTHYVACDSHPELGDALLALLENAELRKAIAAGGRALLDARFGPSAVIDSLDRIYEGISSYER